MIDDDFYFKKLLDKVARNIGFHGQYYSEKHLKRRFNVRLRALDFKSYREYVSYIDHNPDEYEILKKVLPVNVTEWFRNPETFQYLKERIIPAIIEEKLAAGKRLIRIWSAGCSDGKEPYTLAMLFREVLRDAPHRFNISILATDIDEEELEKARAGLYKDIEMKGIDKIRLERFFDTEEKGHRIRPELRSMIKFEKHDLIKGQKKSAMDLILCRNVVIYFSKELKQRLYLDFFESLAQGGYFVMGKTETLMGEARNFFLAVNNRERVYQKP